MKSNTNIEELKKVIAEEKNTEVNLIRLFYSGKEMKNGNLLCEYNVVEGSVLMMMIRQEE